MDNDKELRFCPGQSGAMVTFSSERDMTKFAQVVNSYRKRKRGEWKATLLQVTVLQLGSPWNEVSALSLGYQRALKLDTAEALCEATKLPSWTFVRGLLQDHLANHPHLGAAD